MKELVTKEDADKLRADLEEIDKKFMFLRSESKKIDNFIVRKLFQAVLMPLAILVDYSRAEARKKLQEKGCQ